MNIREITSLQHPLVKRLVKLRLDKAFRTEENSAVIVGIKLVQEISQYYPLKCVVVDRQFPGISSSEVIFSSSEILKKITGLQAPEGIVAEVQLPLSANLEKAKRLIILDSVTDPGNVGTILRTALALNWDGAFLTTGTADPFNEKAIRAAKGASFRLPIQQGSWHTLLPLLQSRRTYVADLYGISISSCLCAPYLALILSNESQGPSEMAKKIGQSLTIPISSAMESLNVSAAGAILMYMLNHE